MPNSILKDINVSVKILIMLFLIFMLFITTSLYFLAFEIVLLMIFILLSNVSVKRMLKSLQTLIIILPFILLVYIIFRNNIIILIVKAMLSILLIKVFFETTSFLGLYNGIFTLFKLYYKNEEKLNSKCLEISSKLYFIDKFIGFNERFDNANRRGLEKKHIKNYIKTKYFMSKYDSIFIKNKLKLKIYKARSEKINTKSKIFLMLSIFLMIIVVMKEVIL